MHQINANTISQGLLLASQKFGGEVYITGDADFRERGARQAVRMGIRVADQDLLEVVEQALELAQCKCTNTPQVLTTAMKLLHLCAISNYLSRQCNPGRATTGRLRHTGQFFY